MQAEEIIAREEFKKCLAFHGHLCPGLSIGYRAATIALDWLRENRSEDEELVAIVETDACGADAIQVLTGCTFGKGNFIFRDHGKNVYSLVSRRSGKGVRVSLRAGAFRPDERHMELIGKMRAETATQQERSEFRSVHEGRSRELLEKDPVELFNIEPIDFELPPKAVIEWSGICDQCGEPTMATKLQQSGDSRLCRSCVGTGGETRRTR